MDMEEKFQGKLQLLMQNEAVSQSRLAEMLGVKSSTLSHILAGRNYPGYEILQRLRLLFPHINADWLLLDSSENYYSDTSSASAPSSDGNVPYGAPTVPAQGAGVVGNAARPSGGVPGRTAATAPDRGIGAAGTVAGVVGPRETVGRGVRGQAAAPSLFDAPASNNASPVGAGGSDSSVAASLFPPIDRADGVRVCRVIVLYDDGSFESFTPRP